MGWGVREKVCESRSLCGRIQFSSYMTIDEQTNVSLPSRPPWVETRNDVGLVIRNGSEISSFVAVENNWSIKKNERK